jgi:hypothetical protein
MPAWSCGNVLPGSADSCARTAGAPLPDLDPCVEGEVDRDDGVVAHVLERLELGLQVLEQRLRGGRGEVAFDDEDVGDEVLLVVEVAFVALLEVASLRVVLREEGGGGADDEGLEHGRGGERAGHRGQHQHQREDAVAAPERGVAHEEAVDERAARRRRRGPA